MIRSSQLAHNLICLEPKSLEFSNHGYTAITGKTWANDVNLPVKPQSPHPTCCGRSHLCRKGTLVPTLEWLRSQHGLSQPTDPELPGNSTNQPMKMETNQRMNVDMQQVDVYGNNATYTSNSNWCPYVCACVRPFFQHFSRQMCHPPRCLVNA